jgi:hypothetical protein
VIAAPSLISDFSSFATRRPGVRIPSRPPDSKKEVQLIEIYVEPDIAKFYKMFVDLLSAPTPQKAVDKRKKWFLAPQPSFNSIA